MTEQLSDGFLRLVKRCNNFIAGGKKLCYPFLIENQQVGLIRPDIWEHLKAYPDVFQEHKTTNNSSGATFLHPGSEIHLSPSLTNFQERSERVEIILQELRYKNVFRTLVGWRDECYDIKKNYSDEPLMKMERSATCLFGLKQYGVHINGYTYLPEEGLCLWIARRAKTKQTWPEKLDNMVAGGIASGQNIAECASKECKEEASVPEELISKLKSVGTVSYFFEDERGLFPECEFIMDLEVPPDFQPVNDDGEVEEFYLWPVRKVLEKIVTDEFKRNSALITLNFCIRHGIIEPDNEPNYTSLVEGMHITLP